MRHVLERIDQRSKELVRHPFFAFLSDTSIEPAQRLTFVPHMAHFVMTFADLYVRVFREEPATDKFQELVNAHTYEDSGHWKWYLADLEKAWDPRLPFSETLRFVWGDASEQLRMFSYHMCRLGFRADSLRKLVLVQCLEAGGSIVLQHAALAGQAFAERTGKKLVYFGPHHFATESNHTLEQDNVEKMLHETQLEPEVSRELVALADECFGLMTGCVDEIFAFARSGRRLDTVASPPRTQPLSA